MRKRSAHCCPEIFPVALTAALVSGITLGFARPSAAQTPLLHLSADDASHIVVSGGKVTGWTNSAAGGQVFSSAAGQTPTYVANAVNGLPTVQFNGATENDVLRSIGFGASAQQITVFLVTAVQSNPGNFRAFLSGVDSSTPGHFDYTSGINIDLTESGSSLFDSLNLEGAKGGGGGGVDIKNSSTPFGTFALLSITYGNTTDSLYVNGNLEGSRSGNTNMVSLQDMRIGARYYDNGGGETGYFTGDISEVIVYDSLLSDTARQSVEQSLLNKYNLPGAAAAPEPGALALILGGGTPLIGIVSRRRRSR